MTTAIRFFLIISLLTLQTACVIHSPPSPGDPSYAPVLPMPTANPSSHSGAIYGTTYGNTMGVSYNQPIAVSLFTDKKAHRVGDVITIVLNERTSSTKSSNVDIGKESSVNIVGDTSTTNNSTLLGSNPSFKNFALPTNLSGTREFAGEADADQSNSLTGNITVTVADILPNGNLVVRGEKWMTLNRGDEYIRVSGIARPDDISPENMLSSQKLANARITYSGTGEFADSQQMGWLSRVFNSPLWPF